jgi:hypothetical protein
LSINRPIIICLFLAACVSPVSAFHDGAAAEHRARRELINLEEQWVQAGPKGDFRFFDRIATNDFLIVDCDGTIRDKQQEIKQFRSENKQSQRFTLLACASTATVQSWWGNSALWECRRVKR